MNVQSEAGASQLPKEHVTPKLESLKGELRQKAEAIIKKKFGISNSKRPAYEKRIQGLQFAIGLRDCRVENAIGSMEIHVLAQCRCCGYAIALKIMPELPCGKVYDRSFMCPIGSVTILHYKDYELQDYGLNWTSVASGMYPNYTQSGSLFRVGTHF